MQTVTWEGAGQGHQQGGEGAGLAWDAAPVGPQLVLGEPGVGMALHSCLGLRQGG